MLNEARYLGLYLILWEAKREIPRFARNDKIPRLILHNTY